MTPPFALPQARSLPSEAKATDCTVDTSRGNGYVYNAGGDVTSRVDSDGTTTTFGYDASDQLTSEVRDNSTGSGYAVGYTYDHNHNRTSKTTNGSTATYTYDAHDKLLTAGAKTYAYDNNGNCTSVTIGNSVTHLSYDVEDRVTSITYPNNATNSFAYNGEDLRVRKVDSGGTKNYVTDGASPASAVLSDGAAIYTPGLSEHRGGSSKFYHADALGSTRGITDNSQAVTDTQMYDAFGNTVSRTGTTPTPFGFVGSKQYQTDGDSGLQLLGHRYYDPLVGRFLSRDPIQDGTNWYAYCDNDPLGSTDADGLQSTRRRPPRARKPVTPVVPTVPPARPPAPVPVHGPAIPIPIIRRLPNAPIPIIRTHPPGFEPIAPGSPPTGGPPPGIPPPDDPPLDPTPRPPLYGPPPPYFPPDPDHPQNPLYPDHSGSS